MSDKIIYSEPPLFNLDLLKMGYFILYKREKKGFIGKQIEKRQLANGIDPHDACYTHIEVSGGGRHSVDIAPPRSKLIEITEKHQGRYIRIMKYKNYDKRYKVAYFSASLCNRGYDVRGTLSFIFKWIKQDNRLWFCSEGALWSLQMVYPDAINGMNPSKCMPADFCREDYFEKVWEGKITDE